MRLRLTLSLLVAFLALPVIAHAGSRLLVAQLSAAPGGDAAAYSAAATAARHADAAAIARAQPRLAALGLFVRRRLLDGMPQPAASGRASASAAVPAPIPGFAPERIVLLEAPDSALAENARLALGDDPVIDWVEPLQLRTLALDHLGAAPEHAPPAHAALLDSLPNESLFRSGDQYGLYNIGSSGTFGGIARADVHAIEGWRLGVGANDLILAVADTGVDPDQPELGGFMPDGSPRIVNAIEVAEDSVQSVIDLYGHGTPVCGVVCARTNDGPHFGTRGIAGVCGGDGAGIAGCRLMPIKISPGHTGEATSFDIARAAMVAADAGARAMNLSYAGDGPSRLERMGLAYALVRGCVVVVASGNKGTLDPRLPQYPSAYSSEGLCIQVGASDSFDERVGFSSYGPGLDLVAPGVNVYTTFMTYPSYYGATYDGYVAASGTSFAAPFVTGAVGLLAAQRPELTDTDFQHVLRESAADIGAPGVDLETGYGRLDLGRALAAIPPSFGVWHDEARADSFVADGTGFLRIGESGPGTLDRVRGVRAATRWQALATVTLPDSFVDSVRVWPRVGGTLAVRGDFQLPYFAATAQVIAQSGRTFTLRGYLYHLDDDTCATCTDHDVPLPPEYVRFGFTVVGKVAHATAPPVLVHPNAPLVAAPNPFRGALAIDAPAAGEIVVLDAGGRAVRRVRTRGGAYTWDGRDEAGRSAAPGLYFVRWRATDGRAQRSARVVRLGA